MLRRTLPARRLAVAAVLPLALTTLAACGDDEGGTATDAGARSSTSATPTQGAETEDAEVTGEEIEPAEFVKISKAAYEKATTAHMTVAVESAVGAIQAEGDVDYGAKPFESALTMTGAAFQGQAAQVVIADRAMFMKMDAMGPTWMKVALDDPSNPLGALSGQLDPSAMLEAAGDHLESVVYEGQEEIDGDTVDTYTVMIDAAAALEGLGQGLPSTAQVPETVETTMSFDSDGLPRRVETSLGEGVGGMTMDLTDWGIPVSIEAPPADQVTDFDLGALTGGTIAGS